jgi:hypothetical protein
MRALSNSQRDFLLQVLLASMMAAVPAFGFSTVQSFSRTIPSHLLKAGSTFPVLRVPKINPAVKSFRPSVFAHQWRAAATVSAPDTLRAQYTAAMLARMSWFSGQGIVNSWVTSDRPINLALFLRSVTKAVAAPSARSSASNLPGLSHEKNSLDSGPKISAIRCYDGSLDASPHAASE